MKKLIFKISTGIFLAGFLLVNISLQDPKANDRELLMANIGAFASARMSVGLPDDCDATQQNVNCSSGGITYTFAIKK